MLPCEKRTRSSRIDINHSSYLYEFIEIVQHIFEKKLLSSKKKNPFRGVVSSIFCHQEVLKTKKYLFSTKKFLNRRVTCLVVVRHVSKMIRMTIVRALIHEHKIPKGSLSDLDSL